MSAINFRVDFARRTDPEGDRVVVTLTASSSTTSGERASRLRSSRHEPAAVRHPPPTPEDAFPWGFRGIRSRESTGGVTQE